MRITGLCGGIGAGKSTVAAMFAEHGAYVVDVDQVGRDVIAAAGRAEASVIAAFGDRVVAADGAIDRGALAAIVFSDPAELSRLEAISHPAIDAELDAHLDRAVASGATWVVLDMAVLVESTLGHALPSGRGYDTVVVVEAPEAVRVARLATTRGMDPADATARIASQTDDETRRAVADIVIGNDGDLADLARQVEAALPNLREQSTKPAPGPTEPG